MYQQLHDLRQTVASGDQLAARLDADLAYLTAMLGERPELNDYVKATQGCDARGWDSDYVSERGDIARDRLERLGVGWSKDTDNDLRQLERPLTPEDAADAIRLAAVELEPLVRKVTNTSAPYHLKVEIADVDAYWAYWLDGAGSEVRLRLNLRNAKFTEVRARQFALHEVLGHGLQSASLAARCQEEDVPWVRLLSVHAPYQVMLEGLAQAMPLFVVPEDAALEARVRLDHYVQLVRSELHLAINNGATVRDCVEHAHARVPYWNDEEIGNELSDRGADPLLRSYLWSYPAGIDWFVALAEADSTAIRKVLHAAYREPLTPAGLTGLWPAGPAIGGSGEPVRLWQSQVP
ncbi:MAG: hypothetical protein WBA97_20080 [Actinophytocola sp.]|uniref:hypothetical protein n=1 Tax=Actinophytocola sp. TaxID=1872138 RepID=UPI003C77E739